MADEISVEAAGGRSLRGTSMKAVYTKGSDPWLTLAETVEDGDSSIKVGEFRVRAWVDTSLRSRCEK